MQLVGRGSERVNPPGRQGTGVAAYEKGVGVLKLCNYFIKSCK